MFAESTSFSAPKMTEKTAGMMMMFVQSRFYGKEVILGDDKMSFVHCLSSVINRHCVFYHNWMFLSYLMPIYCWFTCYIVGSDIWNISLLDDC